MTNEADVRAAAKDATAIINCAAVLGGSAQDMTAQRATNHLGAVHCYDAGAAAGVRVVELTTTTFFRHDQRLNETPVVLAPDEAGDDPYTVTKGAAYRDGMARVEAGNDIVFVVPGGTFGPTPALQRNLGPTGYNGLVRAAVRGRVHDYIAYPVPWVRAEDVARASLAAVDLGGRGATYLAFGREDAQTTASLLNLACEAAGVDHRVGEVKAVAGDQGQIDRFGATQVTLALRAWPTPWFDNLRTRKELAYRPVPLEEAVAETVAWLRAAGKL
jgi:nucleoside-diphosphate-sugar epimerase